MKTLLLRFLIDNWQRKLFSLILAMIIWMAVNLSMTMTKIISNIPVRVINMPQEKTIEGMQVNGILNKRIVLTITGNKSVMDDLTSKDLEVVIDAQGKSDQWIASITKKNLASLNPDLDISKMINRVAPYDMIIKQSKLVTEKIPVRVTHPIGESPKGYQFLDVWPYQLFVTVNGPEDAVKRLKTRGLQLTFNLSDISHAELDASFVEKKNSDEVSFNVPLTWKKVSLPMLSDTPIEIDDPQAKNLRIDFSRQDMIPLDAPIPVVIYFPPKFSSTLNPETYTLATNDFIVKKNGVKMITYPLYASGVSQLFVDIVKDMIQVVVIAGSKSEQDTLLWNAEFIYPHELEDRFVARMLSDTDNDDDEIQPQLREEYLRNRFRSYMFHFRLYTANNKKLVLKIELQANTISVTPQNL
ncbi:MAG: hypothetical protein HW387_42 [Parachlamydiales bacterium]|nr:hypothetical protein [Parachlamydiales bacterium]